MSSRFARPDTEILKISQGDTLTVKRRLNAADSRRMRAMIEMPTLAEPGIVMAYLVDWSIKDDAGKLVPIAGVPASDFAVAIDNLEEDTFDEIYAAVAAHKKAMEAERDAQKKILSGELASDPILPLPSAPASPSMKSETLM